MKLTHHLWRHDYRLCHFPSSCLDYNSIVNPLVEIYFQLSTKKINDSTYLVSPNYYFYIKKISIENIIENDM